MKFNNLGLALGMALKSYTSVEKGLKLNTWKFYGPTFIEVTGGKQVRGDFLAPPSWIGLMKSHIAYSIKFICYSGPDVAAEVTWNMYSFTAIITLSNFCRICYYQPKPRVTSVIFLHFLKNIYFLQENRLHHSANKTYSGSTSDCASNLCLLT